MPRTDQFPAFSGALNDDDELFVLDHGETVTQKDKRINVAHARRQLVKAAFMEPRDPGVNDDETQDYAAGNFGINTATGALFTLVDASAGAAAWAPAGSTGGSDPTRVPKLADVRAYNAHASLDEAADLAAYVRVTAAATITLPDDFPTGWQCVIVNATDAATVALTAATTLTLPSGFEPEIQNRRAVTVIHVGSNVWEVHGALIEEEA